MKFLRYLVREISKKREVIGSFDCFRDMRVVVVGPCSDYSTDLIHKVSESDTLVVVNKGHRSDLYADLRNHATKATLFHCLDRSEETGGGDFGSFELRMKGFDRVFYPLSGDRYKHNLRIFHEKNFSLLPLFRIDGEAYTKLVQSVGGFVPNTGYAAIWTIVMGGCRSIHVSGFNFFRHSYGRGYHDHLRTLDEAISLIEEHGNHNPDCDLESFREIYRDFNITVDGCLKEILSRPTERLFYRS